jgi:hypothetical protein
MAEARVTDERMYGPIYSKRFCHQDKSFGSALFLIFEAFKLKVSRAIRLNGFPEANKKEKEGRKPIVAKQTRKIPVSQNWSDSPYYRLCVKVI